MDDNLIVTEPPKQAICDECTQSEREIKKDQAQKDSSRDDNQSDTHQLDSSSITHSQAVAMEQERIAAAFLETQRRQSITATTDAQSCSSGSHFRHDSAVATSDLHRSDPRAIEMEDGTPVSEYQDANFRGSCIPAIWNMTASNSTGSSSSSDGNSVDVSKNEDEGHRAKRQRRR